MRNRITQTTLVEVEHYEPTRIAQALMSQVGGYQSDLFILSSQGEAVVLPK